MNYFQKYKNFAKEEIELGNFKFFEIEERAVIDLEQSEDLFLYIVSECVKELARYCLIGTGKFS